MLAALTILPVLLSRFGERIGSHKRSRRAAGAQAPASAGFWPRWATLVARHPWPALVAGLSIMLLLAVPAFSLRLGQSDAGNDPTSLTSRRAYDLVAQGFGKGFNGPLQVVAQLPHPGDQAALSRVSHDPASHARRGIGLRPRAQPVGADRCLSGIPTHGASVSRRRPTSSTDCVINSSHRSRAPRARRWSSAGRPRRGSTSHMSSLASWLLFIARGRAPRRTAARDGLPLNRDPHPGSGHESAVGRRIARGRRRRIPVRLAGRLLQRHGRADRAVHTRDRVCDRLRALDGLRGISHLTDPRSLDPPSRPDSRARSTASARPAGLSQPPRRSWSASSSPSCSEINE